MKNYDVKQEDLIGNIGGHSLGLAQLAYDRMVEQHSDRSIQFLQNNNVHSAFYFTDTKEGNRFWTDVSKGEVTNLPFEEQEDPKGITLEDYLDDERQLKYESVLKDIVCAMLSNSAITVDGFHSELVVNKAKEVANLIIKTEEEQEICPHCGKVGVDVDHVEKCFFLR